MNKKLILLMFTSFSLLFSKAGGANHRYIRAMANDFGLEEVSENPCGAIYDENRVKDCIKNNEKRWEILRKTYEARILSMYGHFDPLYSEEFRAQFFVMAFRLMQGSLHAARHGILSRGEIKSEWAYADKIISSYIPRSLKNLPSNFALKQIKRGPLYYVSSTAIRDGYVTVTEQEDSSLRYFMGNNFHSWWFWERSSITWHSVKDSFALAFVELENRIGVGDSDSNYPAMEETREIIKNLTSWEQMVNDQNSSLYQNRALSEFVKMMLRLREGLLL